MTRHGIDFRSILNDPNCSLMIATRCSRLYRHGAWVIKYCMPQSLPRDYVRRYFGQAQAVREAFGYRHLRGMGLNTPAVLDYTVFLNPLYKFESAIAIEYLEGKLPAYRCLPLLPDDVRASSVSHIVRDIKTMLEANVFFKDLHFGNILVGADGIPFWIDPDLRILRNRKRFITKSCVSIVRLFRRDHHLLGEKGMAELSAMLA